MDTNKTDGKTPSIADTFAFFFGGFEDQDDREIADREAGHKIVEELWAAQKFSRNSGDPTEEAARTDRE